MHHRPGWLDGADRFSPPKQRRQEFPARPHFERRMQDPTQRHLLRCLLHWNLCCGVAALPEARGPLRQASLAGRCGRLDRRGCPDLRRPRERLGDLGQLIQNDQRSRFDDYRWLRVPRDARRHREVRGRYGRLRGAHVVRVVPLIRGNHVDCAVLASVRPLVLAWRPRGEVPALHWRPFRVTNP